MADAGIREHAADRQLVDDVLAGDVGAFRLLVERDSRRVLATCARILGDPGEAEDVSQEAFLAAYRALATFRGDGSFGAWVTRIAVRLAAGRLASRRHLLRLDIDDEGDHSLAQPRSDDPESRALDAEQRRHILAAIAGLPAAQREVIALRFYGDLSLEEIAGATQRPLGTVKSRLHRGMAHLREQLSARPTP